MGCKKDAQELSVVLLQGVSIFPMLYISFFKHPFLSFNFVILYFFVYFDKFQQFH